MPDTLKAAAKTDDQHEALSDAVTKVLKAAATFEVVVASLDRRRELVSVEGSPRRYHRRYVLTPNEAIAFDCASVSVIEAAGELAKVIDID